MICISGFLSADSTQSQDWVHLVNFCRVRGLPLYSVRWESKKTGDLGAIIAKHAAEPLVTGLVGGLDGYVVPIATAVGSVAKEGVDAFKTARSNAKTTGKMLAHFLASDRNLPDNILGDQTFSLVGFSLGSQVVKSTINRLSKLGQPALIHNAYFLAGATYVKKQKLDLQKELFMSVVNGRLFNVHTENDTTLGTLFQPIYGEEALGRNIYYATDKHN